MSEGLHAASRFYRSEVDVYRRLVCAQDAPGKVAELLAARVAGRIVLDLGCGTGKYCALLAGAARRYIGIDLSAEALELARTGAPAGAPVTFLCTSAEAIDLPDRSVDLIFSTWVLGTILHEERRAKVVAECARVLRRDGEMLLIENDIGGEFESIRGRYPDAARTQAYNDWLEARGFAAEARFDTWFQFDSLSDAQQVLGTIWGERSAAMVGSARVQQRIVVYAVKASRLRGCSG